MGMDSKSPRLPKKAKTAKLKNKFKSPWEYAKTHKILLVNSHNPRNLTKKTVKKRSVMLVKIRQMTIHLRLTVMKARSVRTFPTSKKPTWIPAAVKFLLIWKL